MGSERTEKVKKNQKKGPSPTATHRKKRYFTNSYAFSADAPLPAGWTATYAFHQEPFVASVEAFGGRILGCQFHPELSGSFGTSLLKRWLAVAPKQDVPSALNAAVAENAGSIGGSGKLGALKATPAAKACCKRVIPCLDCKDGRVVKGVQFENLTDCGDPVEVARMYLFTSS